MVLERVITYFCKYPKLLFLIDGMGAMISAFWLGIIFVSVESLIGIPPSTLYLLAAIPVFFVIFDFYSYQKEKNALRALLKIIAIMNLLYCLLSLGLAFLHRQTITPLGWTYIIVEIILIITLAILELEVAKKLS